MKILVATNNSDKAREILQVLDACNLRISDDEVVTLKDVGVVSDPEEDGATFSENAFIKVRAIRDLILNEPAAACLKDHIIIADDSGLCVDALGGAPGVHSARYALKPGDKEDHASHKANNDKLLYELQGVPEDKRTAQFVTAGVMLIPERLIDTSQRASSTNANDLPVLEKGYYQFEVLGTCDGHIGFEPVGTGGFGYDPLFYADVKGGHISNGQLSPKEKDEISHRGNAIRALAEILSRFF